MSGGMRETQEQSADLEDVDSATFARFAEYIYCGNYTAANPSTVPYEENVTHEGMAQLKSPYQSTAAPEYQLNPVQDPIIGFLGAKYKKTKVKTSTLSRLRLSVPHIIPFPIESNLAPNNRSTEDYSEVFLSHARLYVFAETYQIPGLKAIAAQNLDDVLHQFTCYPQRIGDIIGLVEYIYENTPEREQHEEILREVISHFVANNLKDLVQSTKFQELLARGGSFVTDLCEKVSHRL